MTHSPITGVAVALLTLLGACKQPQTTPPQLPNNDVQTPAATTSDGEVVGADRVSPSQKLQQGPTLDAGGLKPAAKPANE